MQSSWALLAEMLTALFSASTTLQLQADFKARTIFVNLLSTRSAFPSAWLKMERCRSCPFPRLREPLDFGPRPSAITRRLGYFRRRCESGARDDTTALCFTASP